MSLDDNLVAIDSSEAILEDDDDKAPIFLDFNDGGVFDENLNAGDGIHHPKGTYRENKAPFNFRTDNDSDIIIEKNCGYIFN